ncbi:LysR substrate-binding domain-containing protein [Roseovarius aestuarii]|uniref:Glycine cleavage system transcriptional activator n=1 Tax=Roseovarius aestuarii TaxID=475083 RepID=A0A1X7BUW7_9RHOB|nr:LysR substrate-binding domain-containing protein [Roseovarius aestuarii]SMC13442.1 Glycine cleavage system transcriptional activator [Roseovarius aestuarii]
MLKDRSILPRLDHLVTFQVAAELESFAATAKEMNVTEPAISRKMQLLEQHYDCALFVRGHRSVKLTEHGRKLLNGINPALRRIAQVSQEMLIDLQLSTVRMSATNSAASLWLMPRLRKFRQSNRNIAISLVSSDIDSECLAADIDLAILRGDSKNEWPGFHVDLLFGETVFPVCAPSYLSNNPTLSELTSLPDHALIDVDNVHAEWLNWKSWMAHLGFDPDQVAPSTYVNTYPLGIQAAVDGLGVALGWGHLVDRHLQSGTLVRPLESVQVRTNSGYYLLRREGINSTPEHDVVANWLLQESAARKRYKVD